MVHWTDCISRNETWKWRFYHASWRRSPHHDVCSLQCATQIVCTCEISRRLGGWQYVVVLGGMIFVCKFNSLCPKALADKRVCLTKPWIQHQKRCSGWSTLRIQDRTRAVDVLPLVLQSYSMFGDWLRYNVSETRLPNLPPASWKQMQNIFAMCPDMEIRTWIV